MSKNLARCLKALSVETRVRIVQLLKGRTLCVNALAARLGVTSGAVSQHLRVLRDAGLVEDDKHGYFVHYRLNETVLAEWRAMIDQLLDSQSGTSENMKGAKPCAVAMTGNKVVKNRKN